MILENVCKSFGGRKVLDEVSLSFPSGKVHCIMGPSGCGKTTLLDIVAGILPPDSGKVIGTDGMKMAYAFQSPRLLPWKTVIQNVEFALPETLPRERKRTVAENALALVELSAEADSLPSQLSSGMASRVCLARALAVEADILLLDEPFSGLNRALKERIGAKLRHIWEDKGTTVLMATHSTEDAAFFSASTVNLDQKDS